MQKLVIPLLAFLFILNACEQAPKGLTQSEMRSIIEKKHVVYEKAVPEKDLESIMTLYEEGAIHLPFQHIILIGKEEVKKAWQRTFTYPVVSFDLELVDVSGDGEFIHEVGRTHSIFDMNGQRVPGEFKYLNVWRRQANGDFKMYRSIYNQWVEPENNN